MSGVKLGDKLHPATLSRSLKITLEKATAQEAISKIQKFSRKKHEYIFLQIGQKFAGWMQDHRDEIRDVTVEIPQAMEMRDFDTYESLAILAKMVGPNILERCMRALYAQKDIAPPSIDKQLLASIRDVIKSDEDKIHTRELIIRLCKNSESRWRNMHPKNADTERRKIQDYQIASILSGYKGVRRKTINIGGLRLKGYDIEPLRNAWDRYLPDTPLLSSNDGASSESEAVTSSPGVTSPMSTKPNSGAVSNGVTATEEENHGKEVITTDTKPSANDDAYDRDPVRVRGSI